MGHRDMPDTATPSPLAPVSLDAFAASVESRTARVGIVGLGYAGLPLAMAFAETGFRVTGVDLDEARVAAVRERRSYLVDVPAESCSATGCDVM